MNTTLNTKNSLLQVSSALKIQPSSYGAETLESPVMSYVQTIVKDTTNNANIATN